MFSLYYSTQTNNISNPSQIINLKIKNKNLRNWRTEFGQPFCELEKGRKEAHNWMNEDGDGGVGWSRLD